MDPVLSLGPCGAAPDPFSLPDSQESSVLANPSPSHWNSSENLFFGKGGWSRSSSSRFVVVPKPWIGLGSHRNIPGLAQPLPKRFLSSHFPPGLEGQGDFGLFYSCRENDRRIGKKWEKFCPGFPAQPGVKSWRILSDRKKKKNNPARGWIRSFYGNKAQGRSGEVRDGEEFLGLLFLQKSSGSSLCLPTTDLLGVLNDGI